MVLCVVWTGGVVAANILLGETWLNVTPDDLTGGWYIVWTYFAGSVLFALLSVCSDLCTPVAPKPQPKPKDKDDMKKPQAQEMIENKKDPASLNVLLTPTKAVPAIEQPQPQAQPQLLQPPPATQRTISITRIQEVRSEEQKVEDPKEIQRNGSVDTISAPEEHDVVIEVEEESVEVESPPSNSSLDSELHRKHSSLDESDV